MNKRHFLFLKPISILCISIIISFLVAGVCQALAMEQSVKENDQGKAYKFQLYLERGKLSFADGYFETAIKNFKKATDLNPSSSEAHDGYSQAILFKKLGVLMESTESG